MWREFWRTSTGLIVPLFVICFWILFWPLTIWHGPGQLGIGAAVQLAWSGLCITIAVKIARSRRTRGWQEEKEGKE
jgi:hypothetical protein